MHDDWADEGALSGTAGPGDWSSPTVNTTTNPGEQEPTPRPGLRRPGQRGAAAGAGRHGRGKGDDKTNWGEGTASRGGPSSPGGDAHKTPHPAEGREPDEARGAKTGKGLPSAPTAPNKRGERSIERGPAADPPTVPGPGGSRVTVSTPRAAAALDAPRAADSSENWSFTETVVEPELGKEPPEYPAATSSASRSRTGPESATLGPATPPGRGHAEAETCFSRVIAF